MYCPVAYSEAPAIQPNRRFYSPELKAEVMRECRQSGASVAGVALAHGINANIVHRWLRESGRSAPLTEAPAPAFVPITLEESAPSVPCAPPAKQDIHIQTERRAGSVTVSWLLEASASCAAWLREWLR